MIKTIIFDLGGVIVSPKVEKINDMMAEYLEIETKIFKREFLKHKPWLTKGKINLEEVYACVFKDIGRKDLSAKEAVKKHLAIFTEIISKLDEEVLNIVKNLRKKGYCVVCLVNAEPEVVPIVRKRGVYSYFEKAYISAELGMMKPDPKIFKHVLRDLKCKPEHVFFIDDNIEFVNAAKRSGINAMQFKPGIDLKKELIKSGISLS